MSIMRSILTGALSVPVERQQAKFANKTEMDLYNKKLDAEFTNNVALKEKEIELGIAEDQRKENEAMAKRKDFLIALGFTPEYLDFKGNGILVSDGAMNSFLEVGKNTYGVNNWWNTPTAFAPEGQDTTGKTIQEIELGGFGMSSGSKFNKDTVTSNVKNNSNLSDNISDVELGNYKDDKTNTGNFNYSTNYFFPQPTKAISEGSLYVNSSVNNGNPVYAYQIEQTPGKGDFGATWYVDTVGTDGKVNTGVLDLAQGSGWYKGDSDIGKKIIMQTQGLFDPPNLSKVNYMAQVGTKNFYVGGVDDGSGNITLNYVDPRLQKIIGFNALNYSADTTQIPGVPVDVGTTAPTSYNTFSMPIDEWNAKYEIPLAPYSKEEVFPKVEPEVFGASILDVGRGQKQGLEIIFGNQAFDPQDLGDGTFRMSVIGNEPQLESAVQSFNQIVVNTDVYFRNLRGEAPNKKIIDILGIPQGADISTQTAQITNQFKSLRTNLVTEYAGMIENNSPDIAVLKDAANITDTDPKVIAAKLADYQMGLLTSPFDLVNAIERFNLRQEDKQIKATQNISNVLSKVFPSATLTDDIIAPVEDANTQFVNFLKENITAEGLELVKGGNQQEVQESNLFENLNEAIIELSQGDENVRAVLNQEAFRIINAVARGDEGAPFKIEDIRSRDIDTKVEELGGVSTPEDSELLKNQELLKQKWLDENKGTTAEEEGGLSNWRNKYGYKDGGFRIKYDYDSKTGYKSYVNPDLPPGHVEPRPKPPMDLFFANEWDRLWSETHNPDGIPLKPYK